MARQMHEGPDYVVLPNGPDDACLCSQGDSVQDMFPPDTKSRIPAARPTVVGSRLFALRAHLQRTRWGASSTMRLTAAPNSAGVNVEHCMVECVQPAPGSSLPLKVRRKVIRRTVEGWAGEGGRTGRTPPSAAAAPWCGDRRKRTLPSVVARVWCGARHGDGESCVIRGDGWLRHECEVGSV